MIAKRAIIWMLLYCHNLQTIVAVCNNSWKNVLSKLFVRANSLSILRHTDMAFVYEQRICAWFEIFYLELVRICGIPHLGTEYLCVFVLYNSSAPCWNSFSASSVPINAQFIKVAVFHGVFRQKDFPYSVFNAL